MREEEFYQNPSWSAAEKEYFYYHLHSVPDDKKSFYLNGKAALLLSTRRKAAQKGVIELTDDAIFGFPNKGEIFRSYTLRGRAYELLKNNKAAEECYDNALNWAGMVEGDKLDALAQVITFILRHHLKKRYDEALELAERIERDIYRQVVHDFVLLSARAIINRRQGKKLYQTANEALKLVQIRKNSLGNHKSGLVDLDIYGFMIDELMKIR